MIRVDIKKHDNIYTGMTVEGHALYDSYGSDIVCGSASILIINTLNSIEEFTDCKISVKSDKEKGMIIMNFDSPASEKACLLLDSMLFGLEGVRKSYGDNYLKINIQEV